MSTRCVWLTEEEWNVVIGLLESEVVKYNAHTQQLRERPDLQESFIEDMLDEKAAQELMREENATREEMRQILRETLLTGGISRFMQRYERPIVSILSEIRVQTKL